MTFGTANQVSKNRAKPFITVEKTELQRVIDRVKKQPVFYPLEIGKNSDPDQLKQALYVFYSTHNKYSLRLLVKQKECHYETGFLVSQFFFVCFIECAP